MKLGYIGLGKMGMNMVEHLASKKHELFVFDQNEKAVQSMKQKGVHGMSSLTEMVSSLPAPRLIWIMVPHSVVDVVLAELVPLLKKSDVVVDGGNSPYMDSMRRSKELAKKGIQFLDVGVSGGPGGAKEGACLMIGGSKAMYQKYEPLFRDISVKDGYQYVGSSGAGHYVKMVHNGIEYGMMQAIAEGFDLMKQVPHFKLDLKRIANVYSHGSVIESRLITWLKGAFETFGQDLKTISGSAAHSGEGLWTTQEAKRLGIPVKVIHESFQARKRSQTAPSFQGKIIMALRNQFGGHNPKA